MKTKIAGIVLDLALFILLILAIVENDKKVTVLQENNRLLWELNLKLAKKISFKDSINIEYNKGFAKELIWQQDLLVKYVIQNEE